MTSDVLHVIVNHKKCFISREHAPVFLNFILNVNRLDSHWWGFAIISCAELSPAFRITTLLGNHYFFLYFSKIFLPYLWGKRSDLLGSLLPLDPTNSGFVFPFCFLHVVSLLALSDLFPWISMFAEANPAGRCKNRILFALPQLVPFIKVIWKLLPLSLEWI